MQGDDLFSFNQNDQNDDHTYAPSDDCGQRGPFNAHLRERSVSKDQQGVQDGIDHGRCQHDHTRSEGVPGSPDNIVSDHRKDHKGQSQVPYRHIIVNVFQDILPGTQKSKKWSDGEQAGRCKDNHHQNTQNERTGGHGPDLLFACCNHISRDQGTGPDPDSLRNAVEEHNHRKDKAYGGQGFDAHLAQEIGVYQVEDHHSQHAKQHGPGKRNQLFADIAAGQIPVQVPHRFF